VALEIDALNDFNAPKPSQSAAFCQEHHQGSFFLHQPEIHVAIIINRQK
jgi:hypothetical protein